jgi:hypothetical protein
MEFVPREILNEILNYLPLAERIRCRRVCKRWASITPSYQIQQPIVIKEKVFELLAMRILSSLDPAIYGYPLPNYNNSFNFEIKKGNVLFTKVRLTTIIRGDENNVMREIFKDDHNLFSDLDYKDGIAYSQGIKKTFCNFRDLIKITNMYSESELYYEGKMIYNKHYDFSKIFYDPMWITNTTLEKIYLMTNEVDHRWFVERWNNNHNMIFDMLKGLFSQTKRKKELAEMIWNTILFIQ